ncbi:MAG: hypothetical protein U5R31_07815 [Acidimicrobiia bacterium]|nr:hypothetical protein [Acidimicrobiia bacterium]
MAPLYQRVRSSVFEWYRRGAEEEQEGAEVAVVSLKEMSDAGLGYVFDHLDLNTITAGFDINPLIENLELSDVILSSTGGIATEAIDNVRSQGVTVDDVLTRITNRLLRRDPDRVPKGPGGTYRVHPEIPRWSGE